MSGEFRQEVMSWRKKTWNREYFCYSSYSSVCSWLKNYTYVTLPEVCSGSSFVSQLCFYACVYVELSLVVAQNPMKAKSSVVVVYMIQVTGYLINHLSQNLVCFRHSNLTNPESNLTLFFTAVRVSLYDKVFQTEFIKVFALGWF